MYSQFVDGKQKSVKRAMVVIKARVECGEFCEGADQADRGALWGFAKVGSCVECTAR